MQKVKSYENGFISNPAVMSPTNTVADLDALKAERNISGKSSVSSHRSPPPSSQSYPRSSRD